MEDVKILIVEDNPKKMLNLKLWIESKSSDVIIKEAVSYTSGIRAIYNGEWDLVFLDMSLPTYDITPQEQGGDKKPLAGKEIMRRMLYKKLNVPVIIITQFETFGENETSIDLLNKEFEESYSSIWQGTINYDEINTGWKEALDKIFTKLMEKKDDKDTNS